MRTIWDNLGRQYFVYHIVSDVSYLKFTIDIPELPDYSMIYSASTWVIPVLLAITLHEAAHGFVAHHFGDDTAWQLGRVSLNPLRHIDPFGTLLLPALLLSALWTILFLWAGMRLSSVPVPRART